jgi:glyoxylase-like metal-dependent hydrolase (beta-lactamase superfamily II)
LREISFEGSNTLRIGKFPAFDYFGDGSFYLLDSPGHAIGHLCGLARTTTNPPTFILMGGDICHYPGIFRPSKYLPVPESISPHPYHAISDVPFCPGSVFDDLQHSRGRKPTDTLYEMCFGHDIPLAQQTRLRREYFRHHRTRCRCARWRGSFPIESECLEGKRLGKHSKMGLVPRSRTILEVERIRVERS